MSEKQRSFENMSISVKGVEFSHQDIEKVVHDFYGRIQEDAALQVPFRSVHDWPEHVSRLTHFWWTRFGGQPYQFNHYDPITKHFFAGFTEDLLLRWLEIFHQTLRTHLREDQIELWIAISKQMGRGLNERNELLKKAHSGRS